MATSINQNEQGAWVISGICFGGCNQTANVPSNLKVPIKLTYEQQSVDVTITKDPQDVETPWVTSLGTAIQNPETNIKVTSGSTILGDKRYIVKSVSWCEVKPFNPEPEPVKTRELQLRTTANTCPSTVPAETSITFEVWYVVKTDGQTTKEEDVTNKTGVTFVVEGDPEIYTLENNVLTVNNTKPEQATINVQASYETADIEAITSEPVSICVEGTEPVVQHLEIRPEAKTIECDGAQDFTALLMPDGQDVTNDSTFSSVGVLPEGAQLEGNTLTADNQGTDQQTATIIATYNDMTSTNQSVITIQGKGQPVQRTLEIIPSTTSIACDGSAVFSAYTRPDNIDVTTDAVFASSSSVFDAARLVENVLIGNNTGETSVNVDVFATYDNLTSNTVTIEVDGTGETPTSHTLTIIPQMTTLESNAGDVQFDVKYDGVSVAGAVLSIVCDRPIYTDLGNYLVHFYNDYGLELVAKVTARYNGLISNEATVTIPYPLSLTITPDYTTIMCNGEMAYTVRNGGIDVTQQTTFEITASTVVDFAEMNGNVLTAFNSGNTRTAYVVATYNGQSVEATIIIEECALENWLVIVPSNSEIPYNGSQEYAAFLYSRFSGNVGQPDDDPEVRNVTTQTTFTTDNPDDTTIYQSHPNVVIAKNSDVEPKFADITATYNDLTAVASLEIGQFNPQNEVNLGSTDEKYYYTVRITVNEDFNVPVDEYANDRKDVAWKTDASYYYEYFDPHSGEHGQNTGETHYISFSGVGYTVLWNDSGNIGDDPGTVRYEIDPEVTYVALKDFENTTECWDNPDYDPDGNQ